MSGMQSAYIHCTWLLVSGILSDERKKKIYLTIWLKRHFLAHIIDILYNFAYFVRRQWPSVDDCMKADILDCDDAEKLEFDMVDNVLDYLCGPGQKGKSKLVNWLQSSSLHSPNCCCDN